MWDGMPWSMLETASLTDKLWLLFLLLLDSSRMCPSVSGRKSALSQDQPQRHKRSGLKGIYIQHPGSFEKASYLVLETRVHPPSRLFEIHLCQRKPSRRWRLGPPLSSCLAFHSSDLPLLSARLCGAFARPTPQALIVSYRGSITICASLHIHHPLDWKNWIPKGREEKGFSPSPPQPRSAPHLFPAHTRPQQDVSSMAKVSSLLLICTRAPSTKHILQLF